MHTCFSCGKPASVVLTFLKREGEEHKAVCLRHFEMIKLGEKVE